MAQIRLAIFLLLALAAPFAGHSQETPAQAGWQEYRVGKFEAAIKHFRRALQQDSKDAEAHEGLVRSFLKADSVDEARAAADDAIRAVPESQALAVADGEVAYREADFGRARRRFQQSLESYEPLARAHMGLGKLFLGESRYRSAKEQFQRAFELDPDDPDIVLAWASTLDDVEIQIKELERYISLAPNEEPETIEGVRNGLAVLRAIGSKRTYVVADASRAYKIPMKAVAAGPREVRGYTIQVSLGGMKPVKLLVDTGGHKILLHKRVAKKLGIHPIAPTKIRGIGGGKPQEGFWGLVNMKAGDLEIRDCLTRVGDFTAPGGADGIIGPSVFSDFIIRIDPKELFIELMPRAEKIEGGRSIWKHDRQPPEPGFYPVRRSADHLFIPALVNGTQGYFLIDSGAQRNLLALRMARRAAIPTATDRVQLRGISGNVSNVFLTNNVKLEFADFRQVVPQLIALDLKDLSKAHGIEVSGLLGLEVLSQMIMLIDYPNGYIRLIYVE